MLSVLIICGLLSLIFVLPLLSAFRDAGILYEVSGIFTSVFTYGETVTIFTNLQRVWQNGLSVVLGDRGLAARTFIILAIVVILFRFFMGLYEIAISSVLDGAMSANSRLKFIHRLIASLRFASIYAITKTAITVVFDAIHFIVIYYMTSLFFIESTRAVAPFLIGLVAVLFLTVRYSFLALWVPTTLETKKTIKALGIALKKSSTNFAKIFFSFFAMWLFVGAMIGFFTIFTFGIGLVLITPIIMLLFSILGMTCHYNIEGKRYYANDKTITPRSLAKQNIDEDEELHT